MITEQTKEPVDIEFDLGNLSMYSTHHVDFPEVPEQREATLHEIAIQNYRKIFSKLLEVRNTVDAERDAKKLDLQIHDFDKSEYHVQLPEPVLLFPRFNPMPAKREQTKWEKFAKEKGIKKKVNTKMVFDEVTQTYMPRHGSKSLKRLNDKRDILREVKPGQDIYADPFEEEKQKKTEVRQKQKILEIRNRLR